MSSVTTSGSSKKVDVNVLLDKPSLKELSDIKNALSTNAKQMACVMKYAFFQDMSFNEVVEKIFGMINIVDANNRSDVLKVVLSDKNAVLISNIILSPNERCIKFNVGAVNVLIYIKLLGKLGIEANIHLKISVGGISLMDENLGTFVLGRSKTVYFSNGISSVNPTITFGKNNTLITSINGSVGLPPFNASFGSYKKIVDLNGFNNINLNDKGDEKQNAMVSSTGGTSYTIAMTNGSGVSAIAGIFQTFPMATQTGVPVVWSSKGMNNGAGNSFQWTVSWTLSWFSSQSTVAADGSVINIMSHGTQVTVDPSAVTNTNTATLAWDDSISNWSIVSSTTDSDLPTGTVQIKTGGNFSIETAQSQNLYAGIYMGGNLVFCTPKTVWPNATYLFTTTPTYYISSFFKSQNQTIIMTQLGKATKVEFGTKNFLSFTLNDKNIFVPSTSS